MSGMMLGVRLKTSRLHAHRNGVADPGAALADDFGDDGDCDLLGRLRSDIEAKRGMDIFASFARNARLDDAIEGRSDTASGANHPNESAWLAQRRSDGFFIVGVAARDRHEEAMFVEPKTIDGVAKRLDDDFMGGRETLAIGELIAVVDDGDVEPEHRAHRGEWLRDMPGAHDNQALGPRNRIDEDTRRAIGFDSRSVAQPSLADLDQSRMRIGGALSDLVERESLEAY